MKALPCGRNRRQPSRKPSLLEAWLSGKKPILVFTLKFLGWVALLGALSRAPFLSQPLTRYLEGSATAANVLLRCLGENAQVTGATIWSEGGGIAVVASCAGFEGIVLLAAALLSFPGTWAWRSLGLLFGGAALAGMNVVRLASLHWCGVHRPGAFDLLHKELWVAPQFLALVCLCLLWTACARRAPGFARV